MANKFLTTQNKKIITSIALALTGWHILTMGTNKFNIPAQPAFITNPILFGLSLLNIAGIVTLLTILMIWYDY